MLKICKVIEGMYPNYTELGTMSPDAVMLYASANGYETMGVYDSKVFGERVKYYARCDKDGNILSQLLVMKA